MSQVRSRSAANRGVASVCAAVVAVLVSGCGSGDRSPALNGLPLVSGTHVVLDQKICDKGANAYCALEVVLKAPSYDNSHVLAVAERKLLRQRGWKKVGAPVGLELSADSPGDRMRVTYAGAGAELQAIDLGWVKRTRLMSLTLSREIFSRTAAMAVLLQVGTTP